ncbi:MAG: DUF4392 domain-containing protein [Firmicutes bacterium]|nr:DUF4392 domain-containing protein [Bacillota bacterium]
MPTQEMLLEIGERIDSLITLDVPSRGAIKNLYPYARKKAGKPLALAAAQALCESVKEKGVVFIATGWPDRPHINPEIAETDGPPGAAALARALHRGLKAVPIIFIEENLVEKMAIVLEAVGLRVLSPEEAIAAASSHAPIHAASVLGFPTDREEAKERAKELVEKYSPRAVVAIEKGGMNDKGYIHTSRGAETTKDMAKADYLFLEAIEKGITTIGIGDGGNEIGMGFIKKELREILPYGKKCLCGCGGGIVPDTVTDVLVTAVISNWGAYGVVACLAAILERIDLLHSSQLEQRVLWRSSDARFIDGITGFVEPGADGIPARINMAYLDLMAETVIQALRYAGKKGLLNKGARYLKIPVE